MPDPRRARRLAALAAVMVVGATMAAPAVFAQTDGQPSQPDPPSWDASRSAFTDPFEGGSATVRRESFPISGIFTRTGDAVEGVAFIDVSFGGGSGDPTVDTTAPTDPTAGPTGGECIPEDPEPFSVEDSDETPETAEFSFTIPAEESVWPCNGRYAVSAVARAGTDESEPITAVLTVAVPPKPVTAVDAQVLDGDRDVEITWEPLADGDLARDAAGYRVERAGPGTSEGAFGDYTSVGTVGIDAEPTLTDRPTDGGVYRYRVRALRDGADGPVPSPVEGTAVAEATVAGEAKATTTTTTRPSRPRTGAISRTPPRRGTTPSLTTPTTVDPGFENELDYGDRGDDGPELAGDSGRSIIRTDEAGVGLAAPVAGALVLLGWAGHLAYLNRLAKQF